MAKTVQALKILASWTPNAEIAAGMMTASFNETDAGRVRFSSGRMVLKHAIKIDFSDPANAGKVSERVSQIKAALAERGELHDFRTTAGAVPASDAEELELQAAPPADKPDDSALPAGWTIRESDGALILPDKTDRKATSIELLAGRGHSAILARFRRIETATGAVLKSSDADEAGK